MKESCFSTPDKPLAFMGCLLTRGFHVQKKSAPRISARFDRPARKEPPKQAPDAWTTRLGGRGRFRLIGPALASRHADGGRHPRPYPLCEEGVDGTPSRAMTTMGAASPRSIRT